MQNFIVLMIQLRTLSKLNVEAASNKLQRSCTLVILSDSCAVTSAFVLLFCHTTKVKNMEI